MYVQQNKLLGKTSRIIKPYNCSFIATEGPNLLGKIDLAGVEMQYESQYTSRIVLNPNSFGQPLLYGFLGQSVTFLLLKVTYDEVNPYLLIEEDQYIEYYFDTNLTDLKYIGKLMMLSGNSTKRIPQIYLNNPSDYTVIIDVMVGNLTQSDIDSDNLTSNIIKMKGLYHNNITTDSIFNITTNNHGSTQFILLDYEGNVSLYLNYTEIDNIQVEEKSNLVRIDTKTDSTIYLEFLSRFEMYQANSRIHWSMQDSLNRNLTTELPGVDTVPPSITMNVGVLPVIEYIYTMHVNGNLANKFIVYPKDIINYFILSVNDERDGEIDKKNLAVQIRRYGELVNLVQIDEEGSYTILLSISDYANNTSIMNFILVIDVTKPVVTFVSENDIIPMSITTDASNQSLGISKEDITAKTVISVTDNINSILPEITSKDLSQIKTIDYTVTITDINSVEYMNIPTVGVYYVTYSATDLSGNNITYRKTINVTE